MTKLKSLRVMYVRVHVQYLSMNNNKSHVLYEKKNVLLF